MIDVCHAGGVRFMAHSCGAIRPLIPDLIALGVDLLDPIQVAAEGMEPAALKRDFGGQLAFHGGLCTQRTLPFGTPDDVRSAVLDRVATLGAGGGYILASSHDLSADTPPRTSSPCMTRHCGRRQGRGPAGAEQHRRSTALESQALARAVELGSF